MFEVPQFFLHGIPSAGHFCKVHWLLAYQVRSIGVLWSGEHVFEGAVETLELLRSKGSSCHMIYIRIKQDIKSIRKADRFCYKQ